MFVITSTAWILDYDPLSFVDISLHLLIVVAKQNR